MPEAVPVNATRLPVASCNACGTTAELATPAQQADPDAAVTCPPDSGCCQEVHSHADCDRSLTITAFAHIRGEGAQ
jgi:hypothetical protein